jgi:integrin alpha FG-GAP repeat containing protein 1
MGDFPRHSLDSSSLSHPLVLDWYENMTSSLLGHSFANQERLSIWSSQSAAVRNLPPNLFSGCRIAHPHSNAWLDLNGDCKPGSF